MYHKSIDYRRHQRSRIIHKRAKQFQNIWGTVPVKYWGLLDKWNGSCNCSMCREKMREIGNRISEKRKLLRENDVKEYYERYGE